jgi:hypothetical protein
MLQSEQKGKENHRGQWPDNINIREGISISHEFVYLTWANSTMPKREGITYSLQDSVCFWQFLRWISGNIICILRFGNYSHWMHGKTLGNKFTESVRYSPISSAFPMHSRSHFLNNIVNPRVCLAHSMTFHQNHQLNRKIYCIPSPCEAHKVSTVMLTPGQSLNHVYHRDKRNIAVLLW